MGMAAASSGSLVPLYRQVSEKLIAAIMEGEFPPGHALPVESELCARFQVSRITIRKALDELLERHLIVRRRGVGTFVREGQQDGWSVTLTGTLEEVLAPHRLAILREAMEAPPAEVLRFASLPAGTRLKLFEGTNYVASGTPLMHLHYYFPPGVGERLSAEGLSGATPPFRAVEKLLGLRIDHAQQVTEAMLARGSVAQGLGLAEGSAVLRAIRVYYDPQGKPVEILDAAYHPEHYRLTATLYPSARRPGAARAGG